VFVNNKLKLRGFRYGIVYERRLGQRRPQKLHGIDFQNIAGMAQETPKLSSKKISVKLNDRM